VASGETLTYTIRLHNSAPVAVTVDVTDPLPSKVDYVLGSADASGGVYDPGTRTLTWSGVTVDRGEDELLSFVVTAEAVTSPTLVINTATIAVGDDAFERRARVVLVPTPPTADATPPVVHSLTIDEQDVLTDPAVTVHISATDDVGVEWMYLQEWRLATSPIPHWEGVKSSGWVPYRADYPWTLASEGGVQFVGAWVADGGYNRSKMSMDALDYASLLVSGETADQGDKALYMVYYEAGETVNATLTPASGDADLYVWYPGNIGLPDQKSINPGTEPDSVSFVTPTAGTYVFEVYGYEAATYDLSITPPGGPRAWSMTGMVISGTSQAVSSKIALVYESVLAQSGVDPLAGAAEPDSPKVVFLPLVAR